MNVDRMEYGIMAEGLEWQTTRTIHHSISWRERYSK